MYNFLGLTNTVNKRLNEVELTPSNFGTVIGVQADIKNYVNMSIDRINREEFEWPFNIKYGSALLNSGQANYLIPSDCKSVAYDTFIVSGISPIKAEKLKVMDLEEYLEKRVDESYNPVDYAGKPEYVVRARDNSFYISPPPSDDYTSLDYQYYSFPINMENWDDVPSIPEIFKWIIVEGAVYYAHTFKGALEEANASNGLFQEGIKQMRKIYINRTEYVRSSVIRG